MVYLQKSRRYPGGLAVLSIWGKEIGGRNQGAKIERLKVCQAAEHI